MRQLIAYDHTDLDALMISEKAAVWHRKGFISSDKRAAIKAHYTAHFYSLNPFFRLGAFIFCSIFIAGFFGLLAQASDGYSENGMAYKALITGILCIVFLEFMIKSKHYKSGVDDALLYAGLGFIVGGLSVILKLNPEKIPFYLTFLPLITVAAMRYLDSLLTVFVYGFLLALIVLTLQKLSNEDPSVWALILAIFAGMAYFFAQKMQQNEGARFWKNQFDVVEGLSLMLLYACCNYYVVQQCSQLFFDKPTVFLKPLHWFLTFSLPIFYMYQGLKQKNRLLLSVGLLAIAGGVATFRYYFHVVPMEIAAIVGGAFLLGVAYFSIQYLKRHDTRFTYAEDGDKPFYQQAESLIIAQSLGNTAPQSTDKPQFGGGDFGGGGAGEDF